MQMVTDLLSYNPASVQRAWLRTPEQRQGITRHALAANLEVQVVGSSVSGAPDRTDQRSRFHPVSRLDEICAVVCIDRGESVRVGNLDNAPIGGLTSAEYHGSRCDGANGRTARSLDVHASMPAPETARTETGGDGALHGPGKTHPIGMGCGRRAQSTRVVTLDFVGSDCEVVTADALEEQA